MIHWRYGNVTSIITTRDGYQECAVSTSEGEGRAVVLTGLIGTAKIGDRLILNVTAESLGLGTGGKHFAAAIAGRLPPDPEGPGHLIKMRYTPFQMRCQIAEEAHEIPDELDGHIVVVGELHSQLLPVACALQNRLGRAARIVYIMTDGGALPIVLSQQVAQMRQAGLLAGTVTIGHAFGGDYEALNIYSGLLIAKHELKADVSIVMMGPGVAGTASRYGHTGVEQAYNADAVNILGGRAVIVPRISFADPRDRHYGLSHHTRTICGQLTQRRGFFTIPRLAGPQLDLLFQQIADAGIHARHDIRLIVADDILRLLAECPVPAWTMGRSPAEEQAFFQAAGASGFLAADLFLADQ